MDLKEIMQQRVFAVAGDTLNEKKHAHKIKHGLLAQGYTVHSVGKELASFNDMPGAKSEELLAYLNERGK